MNISIHAAREGGDQKEEIDYTADRISIHAAREGGDQGVWLWMSSLVQFQSTPPVKAATNTRHCNFGTTVISIHAAREGGDTFGFAVNACNSDFNPRRP